MEKTPYLKETQELQPRSITLNAFEKEYLELADLAVHDLDAPLRKLSVLIDMLTGKVGADKEAQTYIDRIEHCINDMRALIDNLATWTRIHPDKKQVTPCVIDDIVQQALENMPQAIKNKHAAITTFSLPVIEGNADQLTRLFQLLLENAIEYSRKDLVPEIEIRSSVLTSKEKQQWELEDERIFHKMEVLDNGIGFKSEYAEKIFLPFVRLHGKSQFPGTGIGLAICRKIVDVHHGIIYAEGGENEGAKFVIILPESH